MSELAPSMEAAVDERRAIQAIEALLFSADRSLAADAIAEVIREVTGVPVDTEQVEAWIAQLGEELETSGRAVRVERWAKGYRLATRTEVAPFLQTYFEADARERLSRSLMETLAVVAYRQPVTKPEIDFVRGVKSDYGVRKLLELELIDVVGRSESVGRPLLYGTTDEFLTQFGLQSLDGLPSLREIEELLEDPTFSREKAEILLDSEITLEEMQAHLEDDETDEETADA